MITKIKLPEPINIIQKYIEKWDGTFYVTGECICTLAMTSTKPFHYNIITSLPVMVFGELFSFLQDEKKNSSQSMTIYYSQYNFHKLKDDFLPDNLIEQYSITISFDDKGYLDNIDKQSFSIDKIYWDGTNLHRWEEVIRDFNDNKIHITKDQIHQIKTNLLELMKLSRYQVQYSLNDTDFIELDDQFIMPESKDLKEEFIRIMELSKPSQCFELLRKQNILQKIFIELLEGYGVVQNIFHEYDVYYHSLSACDSANPSEPFIRMAALFHDIGKPRSKRIVAQEDESSKNVFYDHENIGSRMTYKILKRFSFQHNTIKKISKLVRLHMFHYTNEWTDNAVRRFIRKADEDLGDLFKLRVADRLGSGKKDADSKALQYLEKRIQIIQDIDRQLTVKDLAVNGNEIMEYFHLKAGPVIGQILKHLLDKISEDPSNNQKDILLNMCKLWLEENNIQNNIKILQK